MESLGVLELSFMWSARWSAFNLSDVLVLLYSSKENCVSVIFDLEWAIVGVNTGVDS